MNPNTDNTTQKNPRSTKGSSKYLTGSSVKKSEYVELKEINPEMLYRLSKGDYEVFSHIFLHYRKSLIDFLAHLIHNKEDAKDISQDIFAMMWENKAKLTTIRSFKNYLYQSAKYLAFGLLDSRKVADKYSDFKVNSETEYSETPDDIYRGKELEVIIRICIDNMPAKQKEVFRLSHDEGLSNTEIAERLNISKNTVEGYLSRARKNIKELTIIFIYLFFLQ